MSIDDDYFDIDDAISDGTFPEEWAKPVSRILAALTEEEKRCMVMHDKVKALDAENTGLRYAIADAKKETRMATKARDRLRKQLKA